VGAQVQYISCNTKRKKDCPALKKEKSAPIGFLKSREEYPKAFRLNCKANRGGKKDLALLRKKKSYPEIGGREDSSEGTETRDASQSGGYLP